MVIKITNHILIYMQWWGSALWPINYEIDEMCTATTTNHLCVCCDVTEVMVFHLFNKYGILFI